MSNSNNTIDGKDYWILDVYNKERQPLNESLQQIEIKSDSYINKSMFKSILKGVATISIGGTFVFFGYLGIYYYYQYIQQTEKDFLYKVNECIKNKCNGLEKYFFSNPEFKKIALSYLYKKFTYEEANDLFKIYENMKNYVPNLVKNCYLYNPSTKIFEICVENIAHNYFNNR